MIGLTARGANLYSVIVDLYKERQRSLTRAEISRASGLRPHRIALHGTKHSLLMPLVNRKFVGVDAKGRIVPWTPPHETICAEVCALLSVSLAEVTGRSKLPKFVRARRMITKRLHNEYRYGAPAIAKLLNRHRTTIEDYYTMTRASARSKQRVERFRAQQHREHRLAA